MRNTEIKILVEDAVRGRQKDCHAHGKTMAEILANQKVQQGQLSTLMVRQADIVDKIVQTEKDVLVIKTERKTAIAVIGLCCSAVGGGIVLGFKKLMNLI